MEKKAKKFVALLAKKFIDAEPTDVDHGEAFESAVSSLKEGRLKSELQANSGKYQKKFESELQELRTDDGKVDVNSDDTSFVIRCHRVAKRLANITVNSPELQQWIQAVKKGGHSKLAHPECRALCSLLCCTEDYSSVVNIMFLILSRIQGEVETCLAGQDESRCSRLRRELHTILTFFHIKHQNLKCKQKNVPRPQKYEDVLASLLSIYVDAVLLTSRSAEMPAQCGKELCAFVYLLLSQWPGHVVDVLIQSSLPCSPDVSTVLPLARKCLQAPPIKPDCKTYTKYIVCMRSLMSKFGDEVQDICQVAESVKAPKTYLSWLREQREELLDNLPEDRKFKGRVITRFLLHEADDAVIDGFLDILTEELPEARETCEEPHNTVDCPKQKSLAEELPKQEDMPLFFVDKKGEDDKGTQIVKNEGSKGSDKGLDSEMDIIEVDLSGFDMQPTEDALLHMNEDSDMDDADEGNDLMCEDSLMKKYALGSADDHDIESNDVDIDLKTGSDVDVGDDNSEVASYVEDDDSIGADDDDDGNDYSKADSDVYIVDDDSKAAGDVDDGNDYSKADSDVYIVDDDSKAAGDVDDGNDYSKADSDVYIVDDDSKAAGDVEDDDSKGAGDLDDDYADRDVEAMDVGDVNKKVNDKVEKAGDEAGLVREGDKDVEDAESDSDNNSENDKDKADVPSEVRQIRNRASTTSVSYRRIRTRSMTSLESENIDNTVKLKTIDERSPSKNVDRISEVSWTENLSHMTRQCCRANKFSPCCLCEEPRSGSTSKMAGLQDMTQGKDGVEHSASKKLKHTLEKKFPKRNTQERRRPSQKSKVAPEAGSRRCLTRRQSLSAAKSKQYQTRSRSAV